MIKYYCDKCGKELKDKDHERLKVKLGKIKTEVMVAVNGVWNLGLVCHTCIKEIILKGKEINGGK